MIPLSALNQFLFCPRRAALIHIEGIFKDNEHTLRGDIVHEHADLSGYEVAKGVTLLRALPVWSERLGLSGKCDIVEVHAASTPGSSGRESAQTASKRDQSRLTPAATIGVNGSLLPVEFKLGKRRQWENDDAQLCAQALCLEEMFGISIPRGAIFYADSKRRRQVEFTHGLRAATERAVADLHSLFASNEKRAGVRCRDPVIPPAVFKPACEECSLYDICQPRIASAPDRMDRLARQLFQT